MGPIARVLWESFPELMHVGAVLVTIAVMVAVMGYALFGDRAASLSTFTGQPCSDSYAAMHAYCPARAGGTLHEYMIFDVSLSLVIDRSV